MHSEILNYSERLQRFVSATAGQTRAAPDGEPNSDSDTQFNKLARQLFSLQFERVAPYQRFCRARGVSPESITHWRNIPALPIGAYKDFEVTGVPPEERSTVFHSSGTTQHRPSRHFHSETSAAVYETSLLPWFKTHLLPELASGSGAIQVGVTDAVSPFQFLSLTPSAAHARHSSLAFMFDSVVRHFGSTESAFVGTVSSDGGWSLDAPAALRYFDRAQQTGMPLTILGTAFLFVHLLDVLSDAEMSFRLPFGSRVLETGGYKGRSRVIPRHELYALIDRHLGICDRHIVSEYGMSELSSQAYDRIAGENAARRYRFPPWVRAMVVSPETGREVAYGETGLIRIFDLANLGSVLAIDTEDLGVRFADGFELAGRIELAEARGCSLMSLEG